MKVLVRGVLIVAAVTSSVGLVRPQDFDAALQTGKAEYLANCANCHGADGKGMGPRSAVLRTRPADLTGLARENHGVFPVSQVYQLIDGRGAARRHLSDEMPIWGCRQSDHPRPVPAKHRRRSRSVMRNPAPAAGLDSFMNLTCDPERKIEQRIMSIVAYLSHIQSK